MIKRVLSLILALLMIFSLGLPVLAADGEEQDALTDEAVQELIDAGEAFQIEESPDAGEMPAAGEAPQAESPAAKPTPVAAEGETIPTAENAGTIEVGPDTFTWTLDNGELTVSGSGALAENDLPEDYQGDRYDSFCVESCVTEHEYPWDTDRVTAIVLDEGIVYVCLDFFASHGNLTEISLPASLRGIAAGSDDGENDADGLFGGENADKLTVRGYTGSVAETLAGEFGCTFTALDSGTAGADGDAPAAEQPPAATPAGNNTVTDASSTDINQALATPVITSVSNTTSGVKITWGAVTGAAKYRVFYKNGNGWTKIADTAGTSYTWTGAKNNTSYTFTVRCLSADGKSYTSAYDKTGKTITYYSCATPKLTAITNTAEGVKITWGKVAGAAKYRVFYKTGSGWQKIADTAATSYTWTKAKSGTAYTFTVRCINSNASAYTSAYDSTGMTGTYVAAPKLTAASNTVEGVKITWGKVAGAAKYRVFYKTGSIGWTVIDDTAATSYTWTGAKNNTKYTFTVRCVTEDGTAYTSGYNGKGVSVTYLTAPQISALTNTAEGIKITWGKVAGAAKYRVFYKTGSGWTKIADTAATSYTWTKGKSGTTYTFTVRCLSADGKSYTSGYDGVGMTTTYCMSPSISSVANAAEGVNITWGAVKGAVKYRVFYKTGSVGWTEIVDTAATSYTWKEAKSNTTYTFTVRCVSADGKSYTSGYDGRGKSLKYIAAPVISSLTNSAEGVTIAWNAVAGAGKYRVFYKTASGWTQIVDTTATSYTWTGAKNGTNYTFTVRCLSADGKSYISGYYGTGWTVTYVEELLPTPVLTGAENTATGIKITWNAVAGASKYRVFYKTGSGGWTKITDTTGTSYTWTGAKSGTTYTFTVRCLSRDGAKYTSSYDGTGLSVTRVIRAEDILAEMTLQEKIYQLFIVKPEQLTGASKVTQADGTAKTALQTKPVGGIVYFAQNLVNRSQTVQMISNFQSYSDIPLFMAVDEEGGTVARIGNNSAMGTTSFPSMASIGATGDTSRAYSVGYTIGRDISALGFNLDFAPVADVNTNPKNTVIGSRAFSSKASTASGMVSSCVQGFRASGILCTLKHFPGHGDTSEDSHYGQATTYKTLAELQAEEFLPFTAGIKAGVPVVMIGHITAPNAVSDGVPASMSYTFVTKILRQQLGFNGLVITDSMQMQAITQQYTAGTAAVKALQAGVDIILQPADLTAAVNSISAAVANGTITEERIDESVLRILNAKIQYGIIG